MMSKDLILYTFHRINKVKHKEMFFTQVTQNYSILNIKDLMITSEVVE